MNKPNEPIYHNDFKTLLVRNPNRNPPPVVVVQPNDGTTTIPPTDNTPPVIVTPPPPITITLTTPVIPTDTLYIDALPPIPNNSDGLPDVSYNGYIGIDGDVTNYNNLELFLLHVIRDTQSFAAIQFIIDTTKTGYNGWYNVYLLNTLYQIHIDTTSGYALLYSAFVDSDVESNIFLDIFNHTHDASFAGNKNPNGIAVNFTDIANDSDIIYWHGQNISYNYNQDHASFWIIASPSKIGYASPSTTSIRHYLINSYTQDVSEVVTNPDSSVVVNTVSKKFYVTNFVCPIELYMVDTGKTLRFDCSVNNPLTGTGLSVVDDQYSYFIMISFINGHTRFMLQIMDFNYNHINGRVGYVRIDTTNMPTTSSYDPYFEVNSGDYCQSESTMDNTLSNPIFGYVGFYLTSSDSVWYNMDASFTKAQ